jgi:hypothetical protein
MAKGNGKKNGKAAKTSGDSSGLVPQPHGGALKPGAGGGPQPGAGRPPSAIREIARAAFAERIPKLTAIVDDDESRDLDKIGAMKVLCDAGGVDKLALTVDEQPEQPMTPERVADMWLRLQQIRTVRELERLLVGDGSD